MASPNRLLQPPRRSANQPPSCGRSNADERGWSGAQHELLGDLEVGEAGSHQPQDLRLAERQPRRADPQMAAELGQLLPGEPHRVIGREGTARLVCLQPGRLAELAASHIGKAESGVDRIPGNTVSCSECQLAAAPYSWAALVHRDSSTHCRATTSSRSRRCRQQPMPQQIVQRPGTRVHGFDPLTDAAGGRARDRSRSSRHRAGCPGRRNWRRTRSAEPRPPTGHRR